MKRPVNETARKYFNNDQVLLEKIEKRCEMFNKYSDTLCIVLVLFFIFGAPFALPSEFETLLPHIIVSCLVGFLVGMPIVILIGRCIEKFQRNYVKQYEIDVHDDVVRLVGRVNWTDSNIAYRDLLSVRPGYKIADEAYKDFGCCMAATPASKAELNAKKEVEKLGFSVNTIG